MRSHEETSDSTRDAHRSAHREGSRDALLVPPFQITPARKKHEVAAARELFAGYAASLRVDLSYQDFEAELRSLPGRYAPPGGELLLAWDAGGQPVGCAGLRPLKLAQFCEMKRLYVVPAARSSGLGKALTKTIIRAARDRGYSSLRLDTLPIMTSAARLYERMGFRQIEAYYSPAPAGTVFMELDLSE